MNFPPKTHASANTPVNVAGGEAEIQHTALDADLSGSSAQGLIPLGSSFSGSNVPVNHEAVLKHQQHDREGRLGSGRSRGWREEKAQWVTNFIPPLFLTRMMFVGLLKDTTSLSGHA